MLLNLFLSFQIAEQPVTTDDISLTETTTTVTKQVQFQEVQDEETVPEKHTETIEIIRDSPPQEVELQINVPKQPKPETTEIIKKTEEVKQTKKIEVEIKETTMTQKPKQTEIVIPLSKTSTTDIQMSAPKPQVEVTRPSEEQIEEVRSTIEIQTTKEVIVDETPSEPEQIEEVRATIEVPSKEAPIEEQPTVTEVIQVEIMPQEEVPVEEKQEIVVELKPKEVVPVEESTEKEEIEVVIKPKPVKQEISFEEPTEEPEEAAPIESEVPAPSQPSEIEERPTITVKPVPELETRAPEDEISITERETIEIVKVPEDKAIDVKTEVTDTAPSVTETVQIDTLEQKSTVVEQIVTEITQTHKEEVVLDVTGKPMEEVQLTLEVKPNEKQVPETEEVKVTEITTETTTTEQTLPEVSETHKEEVTIDVTGKPMEEVKLTIDVQSQEKQVPETEEVKESETVSKTTTKVVELPEVSDIHTEEITLDVTGKPMDKVQLTFEVQPQEKQLPETMEVKESETVKETTTEKQVVSVSETHKEEITLDVTGKPMEEVKLTLQVEDQEKQLPETKEVTQTETVTTTVTEVIELPEIEETPVKEITLETEETPKEVVQMTININEKDTYETEIVTTTEKTELTEQTVVEISQVIDTKEDEMPVEFQDKPAEEVTLQIEIPSEKQVPVTKETTTIETTTTSTEVVEKELPEIKPLDKVELVIETQEKPQEGTQVQIEIKEKEIPEVTEVTQTDITTKTVIQTVQLPTVEETFTDEVTLDIQKKPETVQLEIEVPKSEITTETIEVVKIEEMVDAPVEQTPEQTHKDEIEFQIKGKPQELQEVEIKIPLEDQKQSPKESPKETSPKESSPLQAPTTQEIFEINETVEEGSPEFTWGLTSLKVMDGEEARFMCEVKAEPSPEISWFHDEKPITENQDFRYILYKIYMHVNQFE